MANDEAPTAPSGVAGLAASLPKLYTLEEIAEATGLSLRSLQDGARQKPPRFDHHHISGRRFMTAAQVEAYIATGAVRTQSADDITAEIERRKRGTRRRPAKKAA